MTDWPAITAIVMCAIAILTLIWRMAYRDGKVDQILEQLAEHDRRHDLEIGQLRQRELTRNSRRL